MTQLNARRQDIMMNHLITSKKYVLWVIISDL